MNETGHVEIHRKFDSISFYNSSDFKDLKDWIKKFAKPFIVEFETKTIRTVFAEDVPAFVFFNAQYDN